MKKVKKFKERSSMLAPTGVEYGDMAINSVVGCSHGCLFPCYAYLIKKRFKQVKDYEDWCEPCLVSNTLELLKVEIPKLKHKIKSVHLCFATDPFMYEYDEICKMNLECIKMFNDAGIKCITLTKGILPIELANLSSDNEHGITIVSLSEEYRKRMEPGAAPIAERLASLRALHDAGCKTWVSIEPYPTPNLIDQDIEPLLETVSFVDKIIFGRTNYSPQVTAYKGNKQFYNEMANKVICFCKKRGISYHIKNGTLTF